MYSCNKDLSAIFQDLVYDLKNVLNWFNINSLKANPIKSQFMVLARSISYSYILNIDRVISASIDNKLTLKSHIDELCWKASHKTHTLGRISPFLSREKARLLLINCQFLYASLIWMFASKSLINKI